MNVKYKKINPDVIFKKVDGESILLHMKTGVYFGLDEVGTEIWALLETGKSFDEIVKHLTAIFSVDQKVIEADLAQFLSDLKNKSILEG